MREARKNFFVLAAAVLQRVPRKRTMWLAWCVAGILLTGCVSSHRRDPRAGAGGSDERVCEVHSLEMKRKLVAIKYGLPRAEDFEANKRFPHNGVLLGGCFPGLMGNYGKVFVCSKCKELSKAWMRDHRRRGSF